MRPPSRRPLCRCKHNYHTISFNDGLNTDVNTTIKRPPSRRPVYRCKHNYHTITVIYSLHADLNTTTIRPSSLWPLCKCKHNYHTIRINDGLYADVNMSSIRSFVTTAYIMMKAQLSYNHGQERPQYRCLHNYQTAAITTTSIQM